MADIKLNKKYTLEEHLRSLSMEDKDYEILYSIWDLNKKKSDTRIKPYIIIISTL